MERTSCATNELTKRTKTVDDVNKALDLSTYLVCLVLKNVLFVKINWPAAGAGAKVIRVR